MTLLTSKKREQLFPNKTWWIFDGFGGEAWEVGEQWKLIFPTTAPEHECCSDSQLNEKFADSNGSCCKPERD